MLQQSVRRTFNLINAYLLPLTTISVRKNPNDLTFIDIDAIQTWCEEGYNVKLSLLQIDEWYNFRNFPSQPMQLRLPTDNYENRCF